MATLRQPLDTLHEAAERLGEIILGKTPQIQLALACLLAGGHLLIEDLPGVGKTTLAHALARTLGLEFQRVQFTSDLLPADVIGVSIYDREAGDFHLHPGPVFTQVLLADEINRATPKAQSALLEAMEEQQISIDGHTHHLPEPFFVIATQNPAQQLGTYPLPESQLDRFLMRISLGYPDAAAERALLAGSDRRALLATLKPALSAEGLRQLQTAADKVHAAGPLLDYVQALLAATRNAPQLRLGLSPRAGLGLLRAARGLALLRGRDYLVPEDVQAVFPAVAGHRLLSLDTDAPVPEEALKQLLDRVPLP
ncbi:MAG: MoxR family ATPase [Acidihalobacter sp.]|uniref:AAA family ATPase n=1 Tax=Acidihalobacter sp. TaxID=1872108 RepID=UPI00307ED688